MKTRLFCRLLTLGFACFATQPLHAVEAVDAQSYLSMSLDELLNIRLTSSTLYEESLLSVPASMTVYTREQIRELGVSTVEELMDFVPGYQTARVDDPGFSRTYSSRGRRLGSGGREVLILMDGARLNTDVLGGAAPLNSLISLDNVARVEFIRGPGSSIYGSNAIMGVVNVITRGAREISAEVGNTWRTGSIQLQFGDAQRGLSVFAKQGRDSGQQLAICDADAARCNRTAAIKTLSETRDPYGQQELYLRGQWDEFSGTLRWSERTSSQFYVFSTVDNQSNHFKSSAAFLRLAWERKFNDALNLRAEIFRSQLDVDETTDLMRIPALILMDFGVKERETGAQIVLQRNTAEQRWLLGLEYRRPETYGAMIFPRTPAIPPFPISATAVKSRTIAGYFGQYQTQLQSGTNLTFGLRQDEYSDFGGHLSTRLGLTHAFGEQDTLKYLYSTSFRAPSPIETEIINNPGFSRNPALRPEVATNHELIWLKTLDNGLVSTALYTTDVENAIYEAVAADLSRTWYNGHERVAGLEVEWQQQWGAAWSSRLAVTHMFSRAHAYSSEAENLISGSLVYKTGPWLASLRLNHQGRRTDKTEVDGNALSIESTPIGGHTLVGAHLSYRVNASCELYGQISNLFDKRHVSPAQRFTIATGVAERGRTISAGLRWSF